MGEELGPLEGVTYGPFLAEGMPIGVRLALGVGLCAA